MTLASPIQVGSATIRNRLYRAPVPEGTADIDTELVEPEQKARRLAQMSGMRGFCSDPEVRMT